MRLVSRFGLSLLFLLFSIAVMAVTADDKTILRGKVLDDQGEALPGVNVTVKNSVLGTITDENGNFSIEAPKRGTRVLVFSYVGMLTREITYAGKPLTVVMKEDAQLFDEVVVTGYGNVNKGNYTGSAFSVKAENLQIAGPTSVDQMLQGVVPGMLVQQDNSRAGASPKIRVRGTSSLLGSQNPVWVVDGVVQRDPQPFNAEDNTRFSSDADDLSQLAGNAISWLNPSDIESITVLKDASATAIYGAEAANGVIVITTRKGDVGNIKVHYNGEFSIGNRPNYGMYNQMNSAELMNFSKEMYEDRVSYPSNILNVGYGGLLQSYLNKEISKDEFDSEYMKMAGRNTDWFKELFRTSFSNKHTLSISGGNEKVQNRTSIGYTSEQGDAKGNSSALFSATSNTTMKLLADKLVLNFLLKGSYRKTEGFAYGLDPFDYAYNTSRAIPLYNEDGTLYYHERWANETSTVENHKSSYLFNIINELDNTGSENVTQSWGATMDIRWNVIPHLQYQGLVSYSSSSSRSKQYATERSFQTSALRGYDFGAYNSTDPQFGYTRLPFGGVVENGLTDITSLTVRNALVYDNTFGKLHRLVAQVGIETNSIHTNGNRFTRYGYLKERGETFADVPYQYYDPTDDTTHDNPFVAAGTTILNRVNNKLSEYATAAYTYDDRYVLNLSARLDASNRFGQDKNKRFQPTWSVGAKWRIASEPFVRNAEWLNNLDLFASYGYQGNAVESVSPYLIAKNGGVNEYYKDYYLTISSLPYDQLGWEKTKTYNIGLDAAFLKGRFNFAVNYFKKVSNVLSSRNIPRENGVVNAIVDGGEISNSGYDLVVNFIPVRTKDFTWQVSVNTAVTSNEVNKNQRVNTLTDYLNGAAVIDGKPYSTFYSYKFIGLDETNGTPKFANMDVQNAETPMAYLEESGKFIPDFSGGLNMMFKYRNWSLYTLFNIQWGGKGRLPELYATSSNYGVPTPEQNLSRDLLDRWRPSHTTTSVPSIPTSTAYITLPATTTVAASEARLYEMYNLSNARVANTNFIRCRSIAIDYEFNSELIRRWGLSRLSIKASLTNPFIWVADKKWNGLDPETGNWPARKVTSLSLQMTF